MFELGKPDVYAEPVPMIEPITPLRPYEPPIFEPVPFELFGYEYEEG